MRNPGRRLRLMLLSLLVGLAAVAAINWIANPYGAWRISVVDSVYRVTAAASSGVSERVTTAYRVRGEEPTTILVGSSRVLRGIPAELGSHDGFFNASLSGASLAELAAVLQLARANPHLKRAIWGVDFYAFDERFIGFRHPETRGRLEGGEPYFAMVRIKETLLSMQALEDSRRVLRRVIGGREKLPLPVPVPWAEQTIEAALEDPGGHDPQWADEAWLKRQLGNWVINYSDYQLSDAQLALFQRAVATVKEAGIEVIVFVPPLSLCELEVIDQAGQWHTFQHWKRQLLAAGPYWDFSGYGKLDRADSLFLDVPHFKPAVGHVILRELIGKDCVQCGETARTIRDAGVWLDTATVDEYLARQETTRTTSVHRNSACAKVVEEMVRSHATGVAEPSTEPHVAPYGS